MDDKTSPFDRVIMGIDPGTSITGYGIIGCIKNKATLITYGTINMTSIKGDHPRKLKKIFERTLSLIDEFHPDEMSLEAPFFGKNVQSMLKLGRAQGVAMAAGLFRNIPITEYAPRKIKMSITGKGTASKEQVCLMLERILNFKHNDKNLDSTDGVAAAMCHFLQGNKSTVQGKSYTGWKAFITDNSKRVK